LPFGNISFIYPHPVRLIYLPRAGPTLARPCPLLGAWLAFGLPPLPVSVRGEAPFKNDPSGSPSMVGGWPRFRVSPGSWRRRCWRGCRVRGGGARSLERVRRRAGRGMGTRRTSTGGRGEGGEVGGRVAYMYMLPAILPLGNVVALANCRIPTVAGGSL